MVIDLVCERCGGDMNPHQDDILGFVIIACQKCGARKLTDLKTNKVQQLPDMYVYPTSIRSASSYLIGPTLDDTYFWKR